VTIVTGLCDIADALPRVELAGILYPTPMMKQAIATLYAHIISFLIRALEWYESSKLTRAVQSITKPAALRYDDIVRDIYKSSQTVAALAVASSQAEQRDMHDQIQSLVSLVQRLQDSLALSQAMNETAHLSVRQQFNEVQFNQAISVVASSCSIDHKESLQAMLVWSKSCKGPQRAPNITLCLEVIAQNLKTKSRSKYFMVDADICWDRSHWWSVCANRIEHLLQAKIATLWILLGQDGKQHTALEVLKSLIYQLLNIDYVSHLSDWLCFQLREFQSAYTPSEYANILGKMLERFQLVFLIVEVEALNPQDYQFLLGILYDLRRELRLRKPKMIFGIRLGIISQRAVILSILETNFINIYLPLMVYSF
jgi:hypothetical protein